MIRFTSDVNTAKFKFAVNFYMEKASEEIDLDDQEKRLLLNHEK